MNQGRVIVFLLLVILLVFILEQRGLKFILLPPPIASYVNQVFSQHGSAIFLTVVLIMGILIFINMTHINFESGKYVLTRKVVMENMENNEIKIQEPQTDDRDEFRKDLVNGFCKTNTSNPSGLDEKCGKLSKENCNATSCCIFINNTKCVAGDANGPTFAETKDGKPFKLDNYYYQDKCFGNCQENDNK